MGTKMSRGLPRLSWGIALPLIIALCILHFALLLFSDMRTSRWVATVTLSSVVILAWAAQRTVLSQLVSIRESAFLQVCG